MTERLLAWMKAQGGWQPGSALGVAQFPATGRGVQASRPIPSGSVLACLPPKLLITRARVLAEPNFSQFFTDGSMRFQQLPTQTLLAAFLLHIRKRPEWAPYLESLPQAYGMPYFLSPNAPHLPGYIAERVAEQRATVDAHRAQLRAVTRPRAFSDPDFAWAWFTVNSRGVYYDNHMGRADDNIALAPFLDMFNHSPLAQVEAGLTPLGYQLLSQDETAQGDQVFINYGPHGNLKLLLEYGFVIPESPQDAIPLSLDDLWTEKAEIPDHRRRIVAQSGFDQNMSIHSGGVTWNVLACLYLLALPEADLPHWEARLFSRSLESERDLAQTVGELVAAQRAHISRCLTALPEPASPHSEAAGALESLLREHLDLLDKASSQAQRELELPLPNSS